MPPHGKAYGTPWQVVAVWFTVYIGFVKRFTIAKLSQPAAFVVEKVYVPAAL